MSEHGETVRQWRESPDPEWMARTAGDAVGLPPTRHPRAYRLATAAVLRSLRRVAAASGRADLDFLSKAGEALDREPADWSGFTWRSFGEWGMRSLYPRARQQAGMSEDEAATLLGNATVRNAEGFGVLVADLRCRFDWFGSWHDWFSVGVVAADALREVLGTPAPTYTSRTTVRGVVESIRWDAVEWSPDWRTDTVLTLAHTMYEAREFSAMPILADALQDAGCDREDVLSHCRDPHTAHCRGCWVLDAILVPAGEK